MYAQALVAEQDEEIDALFAELDASVAASQATRLESDQMFKDFEDREWYLYNII